MRSARRMCDRRLDVAKIRRDRHEPHGVDERPCACAAAAYFEGYDAAESLLLTARERVLRMGFQTGVEHAQHGGLLLEPARQLQRRRRMRVHAQLQRFEPLEE